MNSLGDVKEKSAKISINYNIWKWEGTVLFLLLLQFSLSWFHFPTQNLLSDAEMGEDVVEGFLGGDGAAGDVGERGEGKAEILGDEVCR